MVTLAQRLEQLRTQRGLTRPALSAALGLPKNAIEKFETGRQTPTKEQQSRLASFFEVSVMYLQGETDDPIRQDSWMTAALNEEAQEPPTPVRPVSRPAVTHSSAPQPQAGSMVQSFLNNKAFQDTVRAMVLEALRTPEGQDLLSQIVKKELNRQK